MEENNSMMQDVLHKKEKRKHGGNTKEKHSLRSLEDDAPETATVEANQEVQNPRLEGSGEKKLKKKKKNHSSSLEGCDISETVTVNTEQDLNTQLLVGNSEKERKKKKEHSSLLEDCDSSETVTMNTEQDLNTQLLVGNSEKKQKKKKDRSPSLAECDISAKVTVNIERDLNAQLLVGNSEKKLKKKKKEHSSLLEGCDSSETVMMNTEQDLNTQLFVVNSEKKRKKKKKEHSSLVEGCDSSETVTVNTKQDLNTQLFVVNSEKKRKKKKKEHSSLVEGCDSSETVTVNTKQDLNTQLFVGNSEKKRKKERCASLVGCDSSETVTIDTEHSLQYVGNSEKKLKTRKKERHRSRSKEERDDSEVRNPRESGHSESKPKKKKKDRLISLEDLCDGSETVTVASGQGLQNIQFAGNNRKKRKKRKKERHNSRSEEGCDNWEIQDLQLVGNGEAKMEKHRPSSLEIDVATQMENKGYQTNKKIHHSCSADETNVLMSAVKTKQTSQSANLMDRSDKKKDRVKAVKNVTEITTKAMQNPKIMDGRDGHKKKRKRCSSSAEERGGKYHCKSAEGGNDSETTAKIPRRKRATSESVDVDTETSAKKFKRTKKKIEFENNVNKDGSLNDSEVPQKSIKKCKISNKLPFENHSADLQQSIKKSFKKHRVKCSPGRIAEKEATDHTEAVAIGDFAEITTKQSDRIKHTSRKDCQETVKTSKKHRQKKCSLSGRKNSGRTKNLKQKKPSALSRASTLEVVITPETLTGPNPRQQNKQQQHTTGSDNKASITAAEHFQGEEIPFDQDATKVKMIDKSKLIELLKDFIPNVAKLKPETMYSMYKYDLPRFQWFKEAGIPIRQGRFTHGENKQLQKNLNQLMELTGVQNEWEFFHIPKSDHEMIRMKQLKQSNLFCCRLAEGIARPWKCVYQRAKKMYDPKRCKGRYTDEELKKLQHLQIVYGNQWKKIAELMDRTDVSVMGRAKTLKNSFNFGPWSKEEEKTLIRLIEEVVKNKIQETSHDLTNTTSNTNSYLPILREQLYREIPWTAIADQMERRNWMQCRQKWMCILAEKMSGGMGPTQFNHCQLKINLIKRLYLLKVDDVGDVDWEDLCSVIGDVPPLCVQRMFHRLKTRYVPDWPRKSFGGIVDFLYERIIPELEAELVEQNGLDYWIGSDDLCRPQQSEFQLREIFDDEED
ncbi:uncharacterized protein LOC144502444 [Mustelus asterias]